MSTNTTGAWPSGNLTPMQPEPGEMKPEDEHRLVRIEALRTEFRQGDNYPIKLSREDLTKLARWEVNLGRVNTKVTREQSLRIRMVAALRDIAPGSPFSDGLEGDDLNVLIGRLDALAQNIKAGYFSAGSNDSTDGDLMKSETPPRS